MDADLYLVSFRQREHELRRELERDRVARERSAAGRSAAPAATNGTFARAAGVMTDAVGIAGAATGAWVLRVRAALAPLARTADGVARPTCCSPA